MSDVDTVVAAWELTPELHSCRPGAHPIDFERAERSLRRRLPGSLRRVYTYSNGGDLLGGNLQLHPLVADDPEDLTVAAAVRRLNDWGWQIPDQLVVFGGDGAGDVFGVWLPHDDHEEMQEELPVVRVPDSGEIEIAGSTVSAFLRGWTAYYLALEGRGAVSSALEVLGVPEHLARVAEVGDAFDAVARWADPALPGTGTDPYDWLGAEPPDSAPEPRRSSTRAAGRREYSEFFTIHDASIRGAFRADLEQPDADPYQLLRSEPVASEPLAFGHSEGSRVHDWIGTTFVVLQLVSDRVVDVLARNQFTGWRTYPVVVRDRRGDAIEGVHGFAVTGRSGPIRDELSTKVILPPPSPSGRAMPYLQGLYFDLDTWDGTDIFVPEGTGWVFARAPVVRALEAAGVTNMEANPITDVTRPDLQGYR